MTGFTGEVGMGAAKNKIGPRIVIEQPKIPRNRVVTSRTVALIYAVVIVIFEMTIDTVTAGVRKKLCFVAIVAL
ncbi:MAG: hypothetical protein DRI30_04760, partial [Chloroflexi bacterium]